VAGFWKIPPVEGACIVEDCPPVDGIGKFPLDWNIPPLGCVDGPWFGFAPNSPAPPIWDGGALAPNNPPNAAGVPVPVPPPIPAPIPPVGLVFPKRPPVGWFDGKNPVFCSIFFS